MRNNTTQRSANVTFANGEGPWAEFVNWLESNGYYTLAKQVYEVLPAYLAEPRTIASTKQEVKE